MSKTNGIVYLVGAGPGDPGLISVRGAKLLEQADVVIYDALADTRLLSHCPEAELIYVGKRAAAHSFTQEQINDILLVQANLGKRVVRLKGGDPFVFGRGGEECEVLRSAGIPFEVVPGITAAIAAPAYAGIPITHRDFNSSFTLITGHEKEDASPSDLDWSAIAKLPCIAFYMGVKSLGNICAKLIAHGMDSSTPAATIQWGTRPNQRAVVGTLTDIPARVEQANITAPAVTIVGKVVTLRDTLNWFEKRPLFGKTIVVTRTRQQASQLSQRLDDLGAYVIEAPTIEIAPPADASRVNEALTRIKDYDWVIFTSQNGVTHTKRKLLDFGLDARVFAKTKIAAIGDATANSIKNELCLQVDLCPESFVAEALAEALVQRSEVNGRKFLLLRADIARPVLRERLESEGAAAVNDVAIYETKIAAALPPALLEALDANRVDWITFTSSSTAANFCTLLGLDYAKKLEGVKLASIGPITSQTLKELGLTPTMQADKFNIDGLVEAIEKA